MTTKQYRCIKCGTYYDNDEIANMSSKLSTVLICHCDGVIKITNKIIRVGE